MREKQMKLKSLLFSGLLLVPLFIAGQPGETVQADQAPQGQSELTPVQNYITTIDGPVLVNKDTKLYKANADMTKFTQEGTRSLAANTAWYSNCNVSVPEDDAPNADYFRVSTNEWIRYSRNVIVPTKNQATDGFWTCDIKAIKINNAPATVYDDYGHKTAKTVPANSEWLTDQQYTIGSNASYDPDAKFYLRIGLHQWIMLQGNAHVTKVFD
ncbi:hypothetical protein [Companilactobacillus sp.]|jgi:hypothetical protein|uniref:hypothetical protein n=2 Tax=Companilactobacillus sp. TaxID=2767905 RepID=UPI0025BDD4CE|nr:hypothetical protein [Companilactobacillus sp.]MCH4131747.1 hypothetical protein [Companilactobacillus sp.]MCI1310918.1 hypothetical protein [Companilactobacillus sp.]MCI1341747.1 hypothetical protein [Companilactobacillus sp.]MCI1368504.1 hypothetical protein [Companilactobacillus sp.]MCI1382693.1 hypothetical protein [Companilactobacillus sp.]